jgi:predicted AAA+ superfamily ATPase
MIDIKRKIIEDIIDWKNNESNLPLMLVGSRQVGKTYILDCFCRQNYDDYIYLNLEKEKKVLDIFKRTLDAAEIFKELCLLKGKAYIPAKTIIFIDEIQLSEEAVTSLKYFCESEIDYNIVCAGSLLGVALNRFKSSFPVGKVRRYHMYPLDFEEFLWAIDEKMLADEIKACFLKDKQMYDTIHNKLLSIYKDYIFTGGMPASVLEYIKKEKDIIRYKRIVKDNILDDYISDMSKYTTNSENNKIRKVYNSIPKQLGRDNNKFSYSVVEKGARGKYYQNAIDWLKNSNLITCCTLVRNPMIPLKSYEDEDYFKVYLNDTGLLVELANMGFQEIISDENRLYKGMLAENYTAQMLTLKRKKLHYWKSKHNAEIDFLLTIEGQVIPVEVKASTNKKSKSLAVYVDKYNPAYSIRISAKNFGYVNKIKSVPLYSVHLI